MKYLVLILLLSSTLISIAQNRILVDGEFDDWDNHTTIYTDAANDGGTSGIDFGKAKIYNDADYIFLYIETGIDINLQDFNNVVVYLDIDNKASTGTAINNIGADLSYNFGGRSGSYYPSTGGAVGIRHRDIGMITAPTVTSNKFEIAIKRVFSINGVFKSMSDSVKVFFIDNATNGDVLPSNNEALSYSFSNKSLDPLPTFSIQKPTKSSFRIMSYNVERDGLFESTRVPAYTRILKATQPDIIGFQEIYNHTSKQVADHIESMLPSAAGEQWYHANADPDCHAVSKYPILKSVQIPGSGGSGNGAFLIDLPDSTVDMLLIVAHPPCCANNLGRQKEIDAIMQFVRESKLGNGPIPIEQDAPIIILGDMNFVGDKNQVTTLLTGDIFDEALYGSDFTPDWDGSNFVDCKPNTTGVPFSFTWYSESSAFSPGRLDYIVFSGSNLMQDNSYSFYTPGLPQDSLTTYNLLANDAIIASDHLPLFADFTLKDNSTGGVLYEVQQNDFVKIYPNPASDVINVSFVNIQEGEVTIQLKDITGKLISTLYNEELSLSQKTLQFNTSLYPAGAYIIEVIKPESVYAKRISVIH
jgi:endonuclease/exonuclease/phosphatase family metal-dependent hydrolase